MENIKSNLIENADPPFFIDIAIKKYLSTRSKISK